QKTAQHYDIPHYSYTLSSTHPAAPHPYTLSLHDALPIYAHADGTITKHESIAGGYEGVCADCGGVVQLSWCSRSSLKAKESVIRDRKSTRLNSSHQIISYAVFFLKKKNKNYSE